MSAYRDGDRTIVLLPARLSRAEEEEWIDVMLERLVKQEQRSLGRAARSDADLAHRAAGVVAALSGRRAQAGECALGIEPGVALGLVHADRRRHSAI